MSEWQTTDIRTGRRYLTNFHVFPTVDHHFKPTSSASLLLWIFISDPIPCPLLTDSHGGTSLSNEFPLLQLHTHRIHKIDNSMQCIEIAFEISFCAAHNKCEYISSLNIKHSIYYERSIFHHYEKLSKKKLYGRNLVQCNVTKSWLFRGVCKKGPF